MDSQLVVVAVSILIGFVVGWPLGYFRCDQRHNKIWVDFVRTHRLKKR